MRFSALPILLAGAGLVSAVPIRVIVVTSSHSEVSPIRFGHAVANAQNLAPLHPLSGFTNRTEGHRRPCGRGKAGAMMRQKAVEISNAFRKALGMPLIQTPDRHHPHHGHHRGGMKLENATVAKLVAAEPAADYTVRILPHPFNPEGHRRHSFNQDGHSFTHRVHRALMSLGPWEGRAVAFVIGCGLGVLLRMIWVFSVIMFRIARGGNSSGDENEYDAILMDAEAIVAAPPQYTYADEKDTIKVAEPKTATQ